MSYRNSGDELLLSERRAQLRHSPAISDSSERAALGRSSLSDSSPHPSYRQPLIDQAGNSWEDETPGYSTFEKVTFCDLEDEGSCVNVTRDAVATRRFRRMAVVSLLVLAFCFWVWRWYVKPQWDEEWEFKEGFLANTEGTFGIAKGGDFDGSRLLDLDTSLVPGAAADPEGRRRLIFVGDIHGCSHELKKLLKKVDFNAETDQFIAVGDVISKGPDIFGVLDELMRIGAMSVRGNHEDRILALAPSVLESGLPPPTAESTSETFAKDSALLRELSPQHLKYLRDMPLMIRIPALPLASGMSEKRKSPIGEEILVVHAGLVPAVSLKKQDPYMVMNMRSIVTKTHLPLVEAETKKSRSKAWHDIWCWYNERLFKHKSLKDFRVWEAQSSSTKPIGRGLFDSFKSKTGKDYPKPQVVVYGHRSKEGLQIERWTKGLDTGCVKGKELTALVLDAKGKQEIVQVGCEDHRS